MVIAVVAVAYGTAAPQLGVAEFSPAARQAIEAPPSTAGGEADGGTRSSRRPTTSTTAPATVPTGGSASSSSAPTTRVPRARQCFGNPPLQTEDPMSPSCVAAIFEGDNGGETAHGVTATEIRVVVPVTSGFATGSSASVKVQRETVQALFDFVNQRFELYGRRLVPVYAEGPANDSATSRALGAAAGALGTFAAITGGIELTSQYTQAALVQELGRAGVVTVARNQATWWTDHTLFDPFHPYLWSVSPSSEQLQDALGGVACRLAEAPATFTSAPDLAGKPRKLGIVAGGHRTAPFTGRLADRIEACTGARPAQVEWISNAAGDANRTVMERLKAAGVTTVVCVCETHYQDWVVNSAESASYRPELLLAPSGYGLGDEIIPQYWRPERGTAPIQVQSGPRLLPLQARPWFRALLATNPALVQGDKATVQESFRAGEFVYSQLLILASGLQAAGPHLTPDTFAAGLMATQFPDPGAGQPPFWQPAVGFGPGDHSFYNDFAIGWWSATELPIEPYAMDPQGSWCYVHQGARFRPDSVPADMNGLLFNAEQTCR